MYTDTLSGSVDPQAWQQLLVVQIIHFWTTVIEGNMLYLLCVLRQKKKTENYWSRKQLIFEDLN